MLAGLSDIKLRDRFEGVTKRLLGVLLVIVLWTLSASADAILPAAAWMSPITILLLIPIIAVEGWYVSWRLQLRFWNAVKIMAGANVASTIAGIPIALAANLLQGRLMLYGFHSSLHRAKGGPVQLDSPLNNARTDFVLATGVMLMICFLVSWWVEFRLARRSLKQEVSNNELNAAVRNANLISYALLTLVALRLAAVIPSR